MVGSTLEILDDLTNRVDSLPATGRRLLIAIAGPPAAGKSTFAEAFVARLNRDAGRACLVPMDGFHLDNRILVARNLLARKGAPETFDAAGFIHTIRRLVTADEVIAPVFDRENDIAIAGAQSVNIDTKIAVVEGNYLLLNEPPWTELSSLWNLSIYLDVPLAEIERRLVQRWLDHGLAPKKARARAHSNDIPNALRLSANGKTADIVLKVTRNQRTRNFAAPAKLLGRTNRTGDQKFPPQPD